jgi:hypothetical protein
MSECCSVRAIEYDSEWTSERLHASILDTWTLNISWTTSSRHS